MPLLHINFSMRLNLAGPEYCCYGMLVLMLCKCFCLISCVNTLTTQKTTSTYRYRVGQPELSSLKEILNFSVSYIINIIQGNLPMNFSVRKKRTPGKFNTKILNFPPFYSLIIIGIN